MTAFTAYQDWLEGRLDHLENYVRWGQTLGINFWRVFGLKGVVAQSLPLFVPTQYGTRYYDELPVFVRWLNEQGIYPQITMLTDCQHLGWSVARQRVHVDQCLAALQSVQQTCLVETVNEWWQNSVDPAMFSPSLFAGFLASGSCARDLAAAAMPSEIAHAQPLSYYGDHTPRDSEYPRKGKALYEFGRQVWKLGKPCFSQEPERIQNMTERDAADFAATCDLFGAGLVIHGNAATMQRCLVPGAREQAVAAVIAEVWRNGQIPLDAASTGDYTRGGPAAPFPCPLVHDDTLALRTFTMQQGTTATNVIVRPQPGHVVQAQGGWTVDRVTGPHGQIVRTTR